MRRLPESTPWTRPTLDAELARSILACPTTVELVVGDLPRVGNDDRLPLLDCDGTPTFSCLEGSLMAQAGEQERKALITLHSGLGPAGGADRACRRPAVVGLDGFRESAHALSRSHLQRALEHANRCHQDELRRTVARTADLPVREVGELLRGRLHAAMC